MATLPPEIIEFDVASIYVAYFKRAPEFQGMQYWSGHYEALLAEQGNDPAAQQNAFKALSALIYAAGVGHHEVPAGPTVSDAWYVDYLYHNLLGRPAEAAGLAYWVAELDAGNVERAELVGILIRAALDSAGPDADYVSHRSLVALQFAQWGNSNPNILPFLEYDATQVLIGVDENEASVVAAQAKLYETTSHQGETFDLTTGVDTYEGTAQNDTFNAYSVDPITGEPATTLTPFDTLDGGAGRDTLNIYTNGVLNAAVPATAVIRNIEIVNIFNEDADDPAEALADVARYQGVQELWQIHGAFDVSNLGPDTTAGFRDIADLFINIEAAGNSAAIALDNVDGVLDGPVLGIFGNTLNHVSLEGTLASSAERALLVIVAGFNESSVTVSTAVDAFILTVESPCECVNDVTAVDLSGSTGNVRYQVNESVLTILGGLGNDTFVFEEPGQLSLWTALDGGAGINTVALANETFQTQDYDAINLVQNIAQLHFTGQELALDAAQVSDFHELVFGSLDGGALNLAEVANLSSHQRVTITKDDIVYLILADAEADVSFQVEAGAWLSLGIEADAPGLTGGTLTLAGEGFIEYDNELGKFTEIDALAHHGELELEAMSSAVAETVYLGTETEARIWLDIQFDSTESSSTIGLMDTVQGFDADTDVVLGFDASVRLTLDNANTLQEAFAEAARAYSEIDWDHDIDAGILFFWFGGNTYLYATTVDTDAGRYDNGDFALRLLGEHTVEPFEVLG